MTMPSQGMAPRSAAGVVDLFLARPGTYLPRVELPGRPGYRPSLPLGGSIYYPVWAGAVPWLPGAPAAPSRTSRAALVGRLDLRVDPPHALVFVDGELIGAASQLEGLSPAGLVPVGRHMVEISASGFATTRLAVTVASGQVVSIRHHLEPDGPGGSVTRTVVTDTAAPTPVAAEVWPPFVAARLPEPTPASGEPPVRLVAATAPRFYVIAGCYAGSTPPSESALRPECASSGLVRPGTRPPAPAR